MTKNKKIHLIFIIILSISFYTQCKKTEGYTKVRISLSSNQSKQVSNSNIFNKLFNYFIPYAYASAPSDMKKIFLLVTGPNMRIFRQNFYLSERIKAYIPSGSARIFSLYGKNAAGESIYFGHSQPIDLKSGNIVDLSIIMYSWGEIYVANGNGNSISVIDGQTNTVSGTIPVGAGPFGVGVNNTTNLVYVTNSTDDTFNVINALTTTVIGGANALCGSCEPMGLGVNPNTNKIYTGSQYNSDTVVMINGADNSTTDISVSDCYPYDVDVNTSTNKVYAALWCGTISIIDGSTNLETSSINVGLVDPYGIAVNIETNKIYIANNDDDSVHVINGESDSLLSGAGYPITVGTGPHGIATNQFTSKIYVANQGSNNVAVINGETDTMIDMITVGTAPVGVAINPGTNRIYVSNSISNTVSVIDGYSDTVIETINVGASPQFLDIFY